MIGGARDRSRSPAGLHISTEEITKQIVDRERCRQAKDFAQADVIRDSLRQGGVSIFDDTHHWRTKDGRSGNIPTWVEVEAIENGVQSIGVGANIEAHVKDLVQQREECRANKDFAGSDAVRAQLKALGVEIFDKEKMWRGRDGLCGVIIGFRGGAGPSDVEITTLVAQREKFRQNHDWSTCDMIRDELKARGVHIIDRERKWTSGDGRSGIVPRGGASASAMVAGMDQRMQGGALQASQTGGLQLEDLQDGSLQAAGVQAGSLHAGGLQASCLPISGLQAGGLQPGVLQAGAFQAGGFQAVGFQSGGFQGGGFQAGGWQAGGFQDGNLQASGFQAAAFQPGGVPANMNFHEVAGMTQEQILALAMAAQGYSPPAPAQQMQVPMQQIQVPTPQVQVPMQQIQMQMPGVAPAMSSEQLALQNAISLCSTKSGVLTTEEIAWLVEIRERLRKAKDWAGADQLKEAMIKRGIQLDQNAKIWRVNDGRQGMIPAWAHLTG